MNLASHLYLRTEIVTAWNYASTPPTRHPPLLFNQAQRLLGLTARLSLRQVSVPNLQLTELIERDSRYLEGNVTPTSREIPCFSWPLSR